MSERKRRREIYGKIRSAIVAVANFNVEAIKSAPASDAFQQHLRVFGTAFYVGEPGLFVTAKHVVQPWIDAITKSEPRVIPPEAALMYAFAGDAPGGPSELSVQFRAMKPLFIRWHNSLDIATFTVGPLPTALPIRSLTLCGERCEEGDRLIVAGFPLGSALHSDTFFGATVTPSFSEGVVSAILPYPWAPDMHTSEFQIDAVINGGNSGGPVVDSSTGEVVGVVSRTSNNTAFPLVVPFTFFPADDEGQKRKLAEATAGLGQSTPLTVHRLDTPVGLARAVHAMHFIPVVDQLRAETLTAMAEGKIPREPPPLRPPPGYGTQGTG